MWDLLQNTAQGEDRVRELTSDKLFWGPFISGGARFRKFTNPQSALDIISLLRDSHSVPLRIQTELVTDRRRLVDTAAGGVVDGDIRAMQKRYKRLMKEQNNRWFRPRADAQDAQLDHERLGKERRFLFGRWWTELTDTILSVFKLVRSAPKGPS